MWLLVSTVPFSWESIFNFNAFWSLFCLCPPTIPGFITDPLVSLFLCLLTLGALIFLLPLRLSITLDHSLFDLLPLVFVSSWLFSCTMKSCNRYHWYSVIPGFRSLIYHSKALWDRQSNRQRKLHSLWIKCNYTLLIHYENSQNDCVIREPPVLMYYMCKHWTDPVSCSCKGMKSDPQWLTFSGASLVTQASVPRAWV